MMWRPTVFFLWILGFSMAVGDRYHTVEMSSLLSAPGDACNGGLDMGGLVVVAHKHGACSPLGGAASQSVTDLLELDQVRVDSIQSALGKRVEFRNSEVVLPARSGATVGSGNFIVTVGLGTPKRSLSLIFDTGSDLTWTQCRPCVGQCYRQKEALFDPASSSSYSNVSCDSDSCVELASAIGRSPSCSASTCLYSIQYGDRSSSVGFFGRDKLTLSSPSDVIDGFFFGCGENNQGLFGGAAGLLGLGRQAVSLVLQSQRKYNQLFSYCLPSKSSSTGFLSFGNADHIKNITYTSMLSNPHGRSFYFVDLIEITVGGERLAVDRTVFSGGTIIDSGTVITRLPPTAYSALRSAFRRFMWRYPAAEGVSILDTCYDMSGYSSATLPKISLVFRGGVELPVDSSGIVYPVSDSKVCLAFAGNEEDGSLGIIGNVQQQTVEVVYDVIRGMIGFAPGHCQ